MKVYGCSRLPSTTDWTFSSQSLTTPSLYRCLGSNLSSEDDLDGAQLWNGIARDICMLVKGGDDFKIRVRFGQSGAISADVQISQQGIAVARHL